MILITSPTVTKETPGPPWAFGTVIPHRPLAEKRSSSAAGSRCSRSRAAASTANSAASAWAISTASASDRMTCAFGARLKAGAGLARPTVWTLTFMTMLHRFGIDSQGAVTDRLDAVQHEIADAVIFPSHRIVQRVGAGVAPMPVKPEFLQGRARPRQFEQL